MIPAFNPSKFDHFRTTLVHSLQIALRGIKHPEAFHGKMFELNEDGDSAQCFHNTPSQQDIHFAWFLTDELDETLLDQDLSLLHVEPNDNLAFDTNIFQFLRVVIAFADIPRVHVECCDQQAFANYIHQITC